MLPGRERFADYAEQCRFPWQLDSPFIRANTKTLTEGKLVDANDGEPVELATESLPLAAIGLGMSLLHLHRQLVLELWRQEDLRWRQEELAQKQCTLGFCAGFCATSSHHKLGTRLQSQEKPSR